MFLLYSNIILRLFSNDFYLTGILSIISATITILWLTLVAVLFWKFIFPINAMQYRKLEKWIHALVIVLGEHTHTHGHKVYLIYYIWRRENIYNY